MIKQKGKLRAVPPLFLLDDAIHFVLEELNEGFVLAHGDDADLRSVFLFEKDLYPVEFVSTAQYAFGRCQFFGHGNARLADGRLFTMTLVSLQLVLKQSGLSSHVLLEKHLDQVLQRQS
jgi:hypothetical protein